MSLTGPLQHRAREPGAFVAGHPLVAAGIALAVASALSLGTGFFARPDQWQRAASDAIELLRIPALFWIVACLAMLVVKAMRKSWAIVSLPMMLLAGALPLAIAVFFRVSAAGHGLTFSDVAPALMIGTVAMGLLAGTVLRLVTHQFTLRLAVAVAVNRLAAIFLLAGLGGMIFGLTLGDGADHTASMLAGNLVPAFFAVTLLATMVAPLSFSQSAVDAIAADRDTTDARMASWLLRLPAVSLKAGLAIVLLLVLALSVGGAPRQGAGGFFLILALKSGGLFIGLFAVAALVARSVSTAIIICVPVVLAAMAGHVLFGEAGQGAQLTAFLASLSAVAWVGLQWSYARLSGQSRRSVMAALFGQALPAVAWSVGSGALVLCASGLLNGAQSVSLALICLGQTAISFVILPMVMVFVTRP